MAEQLDPSIITRGMRPIAPVDPMQIMQQVGELNAQRQMADYRQQQIETSQANEATRQQALATAKKKSDEDDKAEQARQTGVTLGADGVYSYDHAKLEQEFNAKGIAHKLPAILKEMTSFNEVTSKANKAKTEAVTARTEALAGLARAALELDGGTPDSFSLAANLALLNGHATKDDLAPFVEVAKNDPAKIPNVLKALIQQSTKGAEVGVTQQNAATSKQNADTTAARLTTEAPGIQARAALTEAELAGTVPMSLAQKATDARMREQTALQAAERADKVSWILRDGKPMRVKENEIRSGDAPYSAPKSTSETAQDRQRKGRLESAKGFLDRLNELREKINTKMGPAAGITGAARQGLAAIGMDPDVAEYERVRAAGGRSLAVAIMGAQNLSDADANAWADMLPGARVDAETAKRLTNQIGKMLKDDDLVASDKTNAKPTAQELIDKYR